MGKDKPSGEALKKHLFIHAIRLFNEYGYSDTSVEKITNAANVSKGSFYYYYKDKEHLLFEIHEMSFMKALASAREISNDTSLSVLEQVQRMFFKCVDDLHQPDASNAYFTFAVESRYLSPEHKKTTRQWRREYLECIVKIINRGMEQGVFRKDLDQTIAAFSLIGASMWTINWFIPNGRQNLKDISSIFSEIFLNGVLQSKL